MVNGNDEPLISRFAIDQERPHISHGWRRVDQLEERILERRVTGELDIGLQEFVAVVSYQMGAEFCRRVEEAVLPPADEGKAVADDSANFHQIVGDVEAVDGIHQMLDGALVIDEIELTRPFRGCRIGIEVEERRSDSVVDVDRRVVDA
ncbi:MAG: hypothetical protein HYX38_27305 [Rhodospirillales bacterium]|nr:hypothetical protein [Rhodospirillales bacterium]